MALPPGIKARSGQLGVPTRDLAGQRFGRWTVLENPVGRRPKARCRCICGTERDVYAENLRRGLSQGCGCVKPKRALSIAGQRFGRWRAVAPGEGTKWNCVCECGAEKAVERHTLLNGQSRSCGCLNRETTSARNLISNPARVTPVVELGGQVFGKWTVVSYVGRSKWKCRCACGAEQTVSSAHLRNGDSGGCRACHAKKLSESAAAKRERVLGALTLKKPKAKPTTRKSGRASRRRIDETGSRYGKLTVRDYAGDSKWLCSCDCGNSATVYGKNLRRGNSMSCGCTRVSGLRERNKRGAHKRYELTGKKFGRWTVVRLTGRSHWRCRCECGVERDVSGGSLVNGSSSSCGCLLVEANQKTRKYADPKERNMADLERRRHRYQADPEARASRLAAGARYAQTPRGKAVAAKQCAERRACVRVGKLSAKEWQAIQKAWSHRCAYCDGKPAGLTQDHLTPITRGGMHDALNIVPACRSCNAKKGNRKLAAALERMSVDRDTFWRRVQRAEQRMNQEAA